MKFTYSDGTKVGEHEKHLTKVGDGAFLREPYTVTFVSKMETVEFVDYTTEQSTLVKAGTILNVCGLLKSNSAQVEIRSGNGNLYRLGSNSELSLEYTVEGVQPVLYGRVLYASEDNFLYFPEKNGGRIKNDQVYQPGGKYRTSCYMFNFGNGMAVTDCLSTNEDVYYTLSGSLEVYEYDENGKPFTIFKAEPFQKVRVQFNPHKKMKERYVVTEKEQLNNNQLRKLYEEFVFPNF